MYYMYGVGISHMQSWLYKNLFLWINSVSDGVLTFFCVESFHIYVIGDIPYFLLYYSPKDKFPYVIL